ncbi:DUF4870 domain-containing protein [Meiothermus granaticius]|uniref:Tic20-like protein n=1 Tax=Meiothermus granaticius NBRC 107808 TaxID=1227551 RepID=A0A399FDG0_9DEIN|nr:DUF4870 domain-containing protein [Meiothermus granaticius]MCL6527918.1 DUF4870 domain-containing protein [Thermaceae bacterium]RIH93459.1 hypothetical protein Mgrana_00510 [Meiothermus granaticius NBRC 107808]GEM85952.1 hypothetical protein MGR01S_05770 [Meiothermus granaticius NBRC 107808]
MESLPAPLEHPPKEDRNWAVAAHLAPIAGYLVAIGQILVPLSILLFGPDRPFVKEQAKEALNAQISFTLYWIVVVFLYISIIGIPLAVLLTLFLGVFVLWTMIAAAVAVSDGRPYRYPLIVRLIR